jgi:hypothetical protein
VGRMLSLTVAFWVGLAGAAAGQVLTLPADYTDSYLMTGYQFVGQPGAVMVITAREPVYGVQFLPAYGSTLGIDPISAPALPAR